MPFKVFPRHMMTRQGHPAPPPATNAKLPWHVPTHHSPPTTHHSPLTKMRFVHTPPDIPQNESCIASLSVTRGQSIPAPKRILRETGFILRGAQRRTTHFGRHA